MSTEPSGEEQSQSDKEGPCGAPGEPKSANNLFLYAITRPGNSRTTSGQTYPSVTNLKEARIAWQILIK